jgi:type IV secretion system protein TrbL
MGDHKIMAASAAVLALLFALGSAHAAEGAGATLDKIVTLYRDNAASWQTTLTNFALSLFWLLAAIEFAFAALRLAFRGADISEWLAEVTNQVLFIGFFLALLTNSSAWAKAIVDSFRSAANQAAQASGGSANLAPSDIFAIGLQIANKVGEQTSLFSPAASVGLIVCALVILVCFALIAAFVILALVESYIVISAGVLLMGFGGSRWTKDYALKAITYAVSIGAKLFVLQLLVALGQQIFTTLAQNFETNLSDIFVVVGASIVMLALTKSIPDMIQALINGVSVSQGGALIGAAAAIGGVSAGVAVGSTMVARSAGRLASEQLADAKLSGSGPRSALGYGLRFTAATARNIGAAAMQNVGDRLSGRAPFGTRLGQMSEDLDRKAETLSEERKLRSIKRSPSDEPPDRGANDNKPGPESKP